MITNNHNDERDLDITELPTDEYPILSESALKLAAEAAGAEEEPSQAPRAEPGAPAATGEPVRAALSLTHLEAEVSRLQAKWLSIDAEFKNREMQIAALRDDVTVREATIAKLTADVARETAALKAAGERLESKDGEIAALAEDRRARDERVARLGKELEQAESRHKDTQQKLARAETEVTRLNDLVSKEQAAAAAIAEANRQALAEQAVLRGKLQDLEIYINGRHDRWSELNAEIAAHKDSVSAMEKTAKARDAIIARQEEEKAKLAASIHDLERQCAELTGRRKEREEAFAELQTKLAAQAAHAEQQRTEYADRVKEAEHAVARASEAQRNVEALENQIKERDGQIVELRAAIDQGKAVIAELTEARNGLAQRVEELDKVVSEGAQQVQVVREELRTSQEQLRVAREQLADRTAQLAASQAALEQQSRDAERLAEERDSAHSEATRTRAELDALGAHAAELGRLREAEAAETERLKTELASQHELVIKLEAEVRAKQATADLLERSVERISGLGASLAALDVHMNPAANGKPTGPFNDFVATLASDDKATTALPPPQGRTSAELLPIDALLDDSPERNVVDIGERTKPVSGRKLVGTIDGRPFEYPILKRQVTIGRGHAADIRIASHFVSRVHAKLSLQGGATVIEDAGSKNGVLVNSERVLRRVLRDGDVVSLGDDLNMRFVDLKHP
jgi:chromosome segregation ATPase